MNNNFYKQQIEKCIEETNLIDIMVFELSTIDTNNNENTLFNQNNNIISDSQTLQDYVFENNNTIDEKLLEQFR